MAHPTRRIRHTLPAIGLGLGLTFGVTACGNSDDTSTPSLSSATQASSSSGKPGATLALRKACVSTNDEVVKANASWNNSVEKKSPSASAGSKSSGSSASSRAGSSASSTASSTASGSASSKAAASGSPSSSSSSSPRATAEATDLAGATKAMNDLAAKMRKAGTDSGDDTFKTKANAVATQVETLAKAGKPSKSVDTTAYNNSVDDLTSYCSTMFPQATKSAG